MRPLTIHHTPRALLQNRPWRQVTRAKQQAVSSRVRQWPLYYRAEECTHCSGYPTGEANATVLEAGDLSLQRMPFFGQYFNTIINLPVCAVSPRSVSLDTKASHFRNCSLSGLDLLLSGLQSHWVLPEGSRRLQHLSFLIDPGKIPLKEFNF